MQTRQPAKPQPTMPAQRPQSNWRFGERHPQAKLSNHEVELMRSMYEEFPTGHPLHLGYRRLAQIFNVAKTTVRRIVNYHGWSRAA